MQRGQLHRARWWLGGEIFEGVIGDDLLLRRWPLGLRLIAGVIATEIHPCFPLDVVECRYGVELELLGLPLAAPVVMGLQWRASDPIKAVNNVTHGGPWRMKSAFNHRRMIIFIQSVDRKVADDDLAVGAGTTGSHRVTMGLLDRVNWDICQSAPLESRT